MLRMVVFQVVASTPCGKPVYSVADIIEPLPRWNGRCLHRARKVAGSRGYVLVGKANQEWVNFEKAARRVEGLY